MDRMARFAKLVVLAFVVPAAGCFAAGHTSSPWEWGGGVRVAPGLWDLGEGGATVHPMASYTYLSFDGGNDQLFEFGGQVRQPFQAGERPLWFGGEATFSHLRTSIDVSEFSSSSTSNGWSLTGMIGAPIGDSRWGPNVYFGAGISDYGAQGWNIRLGLDLQPTFLWEN